MSAPLALPTYHGCYKLERDPETPHWGIFLLAVSNFVFIVPALAAYRRRRFLESILLLVVAFISPSYHICKPLNGWFCVLPYPLLFHFDFFTAFMNVPIIFHWFLPFQYPLLRTYHDLDQLEKGLQLRPSTTPTSKGSGAIRMIQVNNRTVVIDMGIVNKDTILYVLYGLLIAALIGLDLINFTGYMILLGTCAVVFVILFVYIYLKFKVLPPFRLGYLIAASALLILGALSFGIQPFLLRILADTPNPLWSYAIVYSIIHSIWHVLAAVAQTFFIQMRTYIGPTSKEANAGADSEESFEHEVQTLNVVHDEYKNKILVQEKIKLRRAQEASPYTFYTDDFVYHSALLPFIHHKKV
jgi:hypothetical protein